MKGKPLSGREEAIFHLARAGYMQDEIADLFRTSRALSALNLRACNVPLTDQETEGDAKKQERRELEATSIVNARNQRAFEGALGGSWMSHRITFQGDPRGPAIILYSADGDEDSATWRLRI